jgi:L-aspartate oxidase
MDKIQDCYDVVIVGTGVAGLATAIYLAEHCQVTQQELNILLVTKSTINTTNTQWAQGGIASVALESDSFEAHVEDTLAAGAFTNKQNVVETVVKNAPQALKDLLRWGISFDKNAEGGFDLVREGGHSQKRIWHYQDSTGAALQATLVTRIHQLPAITLLEDTVLVQVQKDADSGFHLQLVAQKNPLQIHALHLVLATGGLGILYAKTTNQSIATGDGYILGKGLGARLRDLSYIQFHPTGLFEKNASTTFLITEALRGAGAIVRNAKGEDFLKSYDSRGSLAPRDIVSRGIWMEMKESGEPHVFLDATGLDSSFLSSHFPNIVKECSARIGVDISKDWIPVVPVQHYSCGGIEVGPSGEVAEVSGLYAIGEVSSTGLHGSNRLASNSLLEGLVFAKRCAEAISLSDSRVQKTRSQFKFTPIKLKKIDRNLLQSYLTEFAGIEKSTEGLTKGLNQLLAHYDGADELENWDVLDWENNVLYELGVCVFEDALAQTANSGVYFNRDLASALFSSSLSEN